MKICNWVTPLKQTSPADFPRSRGEVVLFVVQDEHGYKEKRKKHRNLILLHQIWLMKHHQININWLTHHFREPSQPRRATHFLWFFAALYNSRVHTPWSSFICDIRSEWPDTAAAVNTESEAACAGVLGSSRTWPKSEWRLVAIITMTFESLARHWTSPFVAKVVPRPTGCRDAALTLL